MHAAERERVIVEALQGTGFVTYRELEALLDASPATIRRDLARLEDAGSIVRVHGGAKLTEGPRAPVLQLAGTPFDQSINRNMAAKRAIGAAAAARCEPGEGVMIDGGTTTLQMCPHLAGGMDVERHIREDHVVVIIRQLIVVQRRIVLPLRLAVAALEQLHIAADVAHPAFVVCRVHPGMTHDLLDRWRDRARHRHGFPHPGRAVG